MGNAVARVPLTATVPPAQTSAKDNLPPTASALSVSTFRASAKRSPVHKQVLCLRSDFLLYERSLNGAYFFAWLANDRHRGIVCNSFHPVAARTFREGAFCLSPGAQRILTVPNAGGSSVLSEVMSFELLRFLYGVDLLRTEMEIRYWPSWSKITDYAVTVSGQHLGVSVTRALKWAGTFTLQDGVRLLTKKLHGVNVSSANVLRVHGWTKQILHVWAINEQVAQQLFAAYNHMSPELKSNTLVVITVAATAPWIFFNH